MEYRPFGKTGLNVSAVGFGCWEMGGNYGALDEAEAIAAVNRAIDRGINLFDTAEAYGMGKSEELLAKGLGARRKEVIVVTKFGIGYRTDRQPARRLGNDATPARAKSAIEERLRFLRTDYVDVFLVHWPDRQTPFDDTMRALEEIKKEGKARFVGVSNYKPHEIEAAMAGGPVDVVQYVYHMLDRRMAKWIWPIAEKHGMGVMGYGTLAYGLLTGAMTEETRFAEGDWRRGGVRSFLWLFAEDVLVRNVRLARELAALARGHGMSLPQLAIRWSTSHPAVSVALVGARRPSEVDDNAAAFDHAVDAAVYKEIDAIIAEYEIDTAPDRWLEWETGAEEASVPPWRDTSRAWARK